MAPSCFVDENDLALGKALAEVHEGIVYPGHPDLPEVPRGSLDDEWLPVVGQMRLLVITRDRRIRYRPVERMAWIEHGVRGFVLTGTSSQSTSQSLALVLKHWAKVSRLDKQRSEGPWMYSLTANGVRKFLLD